MGKRSTKTLGEVDWARIFRMYKTPSDAARALGVGRSSLLRHLDKRGLRPDKWRRGKVNRSLAV